MKKLLLGLMLLFLVGCAGAKGQTLEFQGEGDNWKAKYICVNTDTGKQNITYTLVYTGDAEEPEVINYQLSAMLSKREVGGNGIKLNKDGFIESVDVNNGSQIQKDEILVVDIEWEGKQERINLELIN